MGGGKSVIIANSREIDREKIFSRSRPDLLNGWAVIT